MSYNRILAAIDLSKESQQIISKAKETAGREEQQQPRNLP